MFVRSVRTADLDEVIGAEIVQTALDAQCDILKLIAGSEESDVGKIDVGIDAAVDSSGGLKHVENGDGFAWSVNGGACVEQNFDKVRNGGLE